MNDFIPIAKPLFEGREAEYLQETVTTGWISSLGRFVQLFESAVANYCGTQHGISTCNGTTALQLALATIGVGPGDEVLIPTLTFIATANAVRYTGATPIFVDSDPYTLTIDPADLARRVTQRSRAVIPVHLYGHPAKMDEIRAIASQKGLFVIEDAAEAIGAEFQGRKVGSLSSLGCFSFYGNKIVTTGEGGMITTDDENLAGRARFLRDHAMSAERRYWHPEVGYNFRMTNMQAAVGVAQMERIAALVGARERIASLYSQLFADTPNLTLPPLASWARPVCWLYSIQLNGFSSTKRDTVMERLREAGIDSRPFFYPIHTMPPYISDHLASYPTAENAAACGIQLPTWPGLSDSAVYRVTESVKTILRNLSAGGS